MGRGNPLIFFRPPIAIPLMLLALFFLPTMVEGGRTPFSTSPTGQINPF